MGRGQDGQIELFTWRATANICGVSVQLSPFLFAKLKQTNKQTNNNKPKKSTFTYTDWQVSPGTYTDDLTAEKSRGHQSDADLRSSPKYTKDFIIVILLLGAGMLAELSGVPVMMSKFHVFLYTSDWIKSRFVRVMWQSEEGTGERPGPWSASHNPDVALHSCLYVTRMRSCVDILTATDNHQMYK